MSLLPRTAAGAGRKAGLLLTPHWQSWSGRSRHTYYTVLERLTNDLRLAYASGSYGQSVIRVNPLYRAVLRPRTLVGATVY